jgi:hypothetical protein
MLDGLGRSPVSFQKQFRCRYPSLERPKCRFSKPRNLYHGSDPALQLVSIFDPPRKADFDFPFLPDAAGCLTPDRRSRAGGRRPVRPPSDLRSRSRPLEESGCQGLTVSCPPPRVLPRENRTFPRAATGRVYGLWFASGRLDATRTHSKPRYEPMLPFTWGVVSSRHGWDSDTVSSTSPAAGDKMDHDVRSAMIFVCIRTVSVWMEEVVRLPSGPRKEETGRDRHYQNTEFAPHYRNCIFAKADWGASRWEYGQTTRDRRRQ